MAESIYERMKKYAMTGNQNNSLLSNTNQANGGILQNINPDLLLASELIGQGLKGNDPFSSVIPAFASAAKTKSLMTPKFTKPSYLNFINKDGVEKTLNVNTPQGARDAKTLTDNGYTVIGKSVQAKSVSDLGGISKGATTGAEKLVIGASDLLSKLDVMEAQFEKGFVEYKGKALAFGTQEAQKLGFNTPEKLDNFLARKSEWQLANQQFFNNYRKEITGVAAGEKEIGFLKESIPNIDDAPGVYLSKVRLQKQFTKDLIDRNNKFLESGLKATKDSTGKPTGKYKKYLENNPLTPATKDQVFDLASQFRSQEFSNEVIEFKLNKIFGVGNWEKYFPKQ